MHGPLGREGGFEGQEGGFGGVVGGLGLGVVCAVGGDGGEEEDGAVGVLGDHLSETPRGGWGLAASFGGRGKGLRGRNGEKKGGRGRRELPSSGLGGEKRARRVDFQSAFPFRGRHLYGVRAAHDAGEAA